MSNTKELTLSEFRGKRVELQYRLTGAIQEIIDAFAEETKTRDGKLWPTSISVSLDRAIGVGRAVVYDVCCNFDLD